MIEYKFSIVMIAYNVAEYIQEAIDSVIKQDIGFEKIQLIVVNDGSKDKTPEIVQHYVDDYPNNIVLINKENGGPGSARNAGIEFIKGKYVNFMDSDDILQNDALKKVYHFFEKHDSEVDIVSIPLVFFDGEKGEHHLNYKYKKGSRVIDLKEEWDAPQMQIGSCFIKSNCFDRTKRFDERIRYADDLKMVQQILIDKQTLGVVSDTTYFYRKRSGTNNSIMQNAYTNKNWYVPAVKYSYLEIMEEYKNKKRLIPRFIQNTICTDVKWKIIKEELPEDILTDNERIEYLKCLKEILKRIEDEIILHQKDIDNELKLAMIEYKSDNGTSLEFCNGDIHKKNDKIVYSYKNDSTLKLDSIHIEQNHCTIKGRYFIPGMDKTPNLIIKTENQNYLQEMSFFKFKKSVINDKYLSIYCFEADVDYEINDQLKFYVKLGDACYKPKNVEYGRFFPLSKVYEKMYVSTKGVLMVSEDGKIRIKRNTLINKLCAEIEYLICLVKSKNKSSDDEKAKLKAIVIRPIIKILKKIKKREIWIVRDRANLADDNGTVFFKYIQNECKKINSYFALAKTSKDFKKVKKIGKTVDCLAWYYKILYLISDYIISSSADDNAFRPFLDHYEPYKDLEYGIRKVFLQHGVIQNDMSDWLNKYDMNLDGFVCSSERELKAMINYCYGYSKNELWLTGLPRYDVLDNKPEKIITIAPTWRGYLVGKKKEDDTYEAVDCFVNSDYFVAFKQLLDSDKLNSIAKANGYKVQFLLHPTMRQYYKYFESDKALISEENYASVISRSSILITDYSSISFDFAYLRKPVLYYQFDENDFYKKHYWKKGYFSYREDGFGEVETNLVDLVDRISTYISCGCKMKDKYIERVDKCFKYNDKNNCKRVLEKINEYEEKI